MNILVKKPNPKKGHLVLVSKKSGKVASTNTWLLALAAHAQINDNTTGIASLLPQQKALKLLEKNTLSIKPIRGLKGGKLAESIRNQAKASTPWLAALFLENHRKNKLATRKNFCFWITQQLYDPSSKAYRLAILNGLEDLLSRSRSVRWWRDQLKKRQS